MDDRWELFMCLAVHRQEREKGETSGEELVSLVDEVCNMTNPIPLSTSTLTEETGRLRLQY